MSREIINALIAWGLVGVAAGLAGLALNALAPIRRSRLLLIPSFLVGTLVAETSVFVLPLLLVAGGLLLQFGPDDGELRLTALILLGLATLAVAVQLWTSLRVLAQLKKDVPQFVAPRSWSRWARVLIPFPYRLSRARVTRNVVFSEVAGKRLRLDVYHPPAEVTSAKGLRPAVLHIHGGGWVVGDKFEQGVPIMTMLSDRGFVCFNANYRLSPGATWPEHLIDVKRAIAWIREHAGEYNVDPSFVAIVGGSAGGHLTAMAALVDEPEALQPGFEDADTKVQAAVPLYAVFDVTNAKRRHARGFLSMLMQPIVIKAFADTQPERFEAASPIHRVHGNAPPFFVIHGSRDSMAPLADAQDFVGEMRACGNDPVHFTVVPGAHHSFDLLVSLRSLPVIDAMGDFLDRHYAEHTASAGPTPQRLGNDAAEDGVPTSAPLRSPPPS